jgi:hypothetical protein
MNRERGYYWVRIKQPHLLLVAHLQTWCVAWWDGRLFFIAGMTFAMSEQRLEIDERRLVREKPTEAAQ